MIIRRPGRSRAFSLIELLAVAVIMSIILALTVSAYSNFARGVELTNSAQHLSDVLNLARQIAVSRGEYTQVRFLAPTDPANPRYGHYSGLAIFRADSPFYTNYSDLLAKGRIRQEGTPVYLPSSCAVLSNSTYSPLLASLVADISRTGSSQIGGNTYNWVAFYFKPDGSTDIPAGTTNSISVCPFQSFKAKNALPPNYAILTLDRVDGRLSVVRP